MIVLSRVCQVDLSWNSAGDEGAKAIGDALRVNSALMSLDLSGNHLCGVCQEYGEKKGTYDAAGINAIADALAVNSVLTSLDLRFYNKIGVEGGKAIAGALRVNGTLDRG